MVLAVMQSYRRGGVKQLCVCLHFHAPLGGLQENVLATVRAAVSAGYEVSVLCPAGPFLNDHIGPMGVNLLAVDFQSESSINQARQLLCQADLIHAHPGPSRVLALDSAIDTGTPVVFTIHGAWFDNVQLFASRLSSIVCVSEAIKESVTRICPAQSERIECIPNGVDTNRFRTSSGDTVEDGLVVVASRLDIDKRNLIDTLISLWEVQARRSTPHVLHYLIAGQGTLQKELELTVMRLGIPVSFIGWQGTDDLARLYNRASAVIASGRAALESLAAGKPTLAVASAGVSEAFESAQLPVAAFSNFGGFGAQVMQSPDASFDKLHAAAMRYDPSFSNQSFEFVFAHHDNSVVNQRLLEIYDQALSNRD